MISGSKWNFKINLWDKLICPIYVLANEMQDYQTIRGKLIRSWCKGATAMLMSELVESSNMKYERMQRQAKQIG